MSSASSELIGKRYLTESVLGRGGAGEVFRVRDKATGDALALKRLRIGESDPKRAELALLFEREYHTLAQLAHPCIIEVHDYGVSDNTPYYTMELLDGSDLRDLAPLPWKRACSVLCDVASSLALLHSRRLVHRDLSPRNVRCTSDGRTKLIDFGAMAVMGISRQMIGTPAYAAPELANGQELDGRADLYGLGALAYWTLTGRHAFRARDFEQLRDLWRTRPLPPSAFARDVPPELDALVMSLLSFDPTARPSSTAGVISRLRALSGQPADETVESDAYLTTPTLVGRSDEQLSFRRRMLRTVRGDGGSVLIEGAPGLGRSRLLATLVLEGKLAGALVVSASGSEAAPGEYGLLRQLCARLLETAPELAFDSARGRGDLLAQVLPALGLPSAKAEPQADVREALVDWFCDMARDQPLCIAVDDLSRADVASAAFLARLSLRAHGQPLVVAATADVTRPPALTRAIDQLAEAGARISLMPLDLPQTTALLRSVFGDVPNLTTVAIWIHEVSGGRPGSCMQLAQHLVDGGIARFAEGSWSLPYKLDALSLPSSFEQAIEARFAALGPCARTLAQTMSLVLPIAPLGLPDHIELLAPSFTSKQVFEALDELLRAHLIAPGGETHTLRDATSSAIVERSFDPEQLRSLHERLARRYEARGGAEAIVAYHLLHAGDWERSFEIQRALRGQITDISSINALFGRSELGAAVLESLYLAGRARGLSPAKLYPLQKVLLQLATVYEPALGRYAEHVLPQLCMDSGWIHWPERPELAPLDRIVHCVQRAQESHDRTPEAERGLAPLDAIRELAITVGILSGLYARTAEAERVAQLPALLEPFVPLSPVIALLHDMTVSAVEGILHASDVRGLRQRVIDRLSEPVDGLDEMTRQGALYVLSYYQGLDEGIRADPSALQRADVLEKLPSYAPLAWQLRMVYHQNAGNVELAEKAREQREAGALRQFDGDAHLTCSMIYEVAVVTRSGDLLTAKRLLERIAREAERFPGWRIWHAYATASFEAMRGDVPAALAAVDRCLAMAPPVGHAAAVSARSLRVELLVRSGDPRAAIEFGGPMLAQRAADARPLNNELLPIVALAHAETQTGEYARGAARLDRLIAEHEATGFGGLLVAIMYVHRARIALQANDLDAFERFAALGAQWSDRLRHPGLVARLQQLVGDARKADQPVSAELARGVELTTTMTAHPTAIGNSVYTLLGACQGAEQRARHALHLLIEQSGARGGFLFGQARDGLQLLAWTSEVPPDSALERGAAALFTALCGDEEGETRLEPNATLGPTEGAQDMLMHAGARLQTFLLRSARTTGLAPLGLVLLARRDSATLQLQSELLGAVCEGLVRAGDLRAVG